MPRKIPNHPLRPRTVPIPSSLSLALLVLLAPAVARADLLPDPATDGDAVTMVNDGDSIDLDGFSSGAAGNLSITLVAGDEVYNAGGDALAISTAGNTLDIGGLVSGDLGINFSNTTGSNTLNLQSGGSITGSGGTAILGGSGDEQLTLDAAATLNGAIDLGGGSNSVTVTGSGTIVADISGAGTLTLDGSGTQTLSGTVGGSSLVKSGASYATITGDATFDSIDVQAGDLYIGSGSSGSLSGDIGIASGSLLYFNRTDSTAFAGDLSGGGNIAQIGGGTLTLSGNNSYSGETWVFAGVLEASGGSAIGDNSAVAIFKGGTLRLAADETIGSLADDTSGFPPTGTRTVDTGGFLLTTGGLGTSTAFSGVITGSGGIAKQGAGTLTLSGSNDYSGATQVNAGTLQADGGAAIGDLSAVSVAAGATLTLGAAETIGSLAGAGSVDTGGFLLTAGGDNSSTAFSGVLSGAGGFSKQGSGTLTLSGSNTYSGATTIDAGTLQLNGGAAIADTSAVSVAAGATLALGAAETLGSLAGDGNVDNGGFLLGSGGDNSSTTFGGVISGAGGLVKTGTGTLVLTGNNSYGGGTTLASGGALFVGNGGSSGAITGAVTNNGALMFNRSDDILFGGAISGSGTVTKAGSGKLTLSGVHTYTGVTSVAAGSLRLTGVLVNSGLTVLSGAHIEGIGSADSLTLNAGSVFDVYANAAGVADRLTISGPVTLGGGTVNVIADPSGAWSYSTAYTIIRGASPASGTFSAVQTDLAFLDPALAYAGNDVILTLTRNDLGFAVVARNGNEAAVANALTGIAATDPGSPLQPVIDTITGLSTADAQAALASLNGQSLANIGPQLQDMWSTVRGWHDDRRAQFTAVRKPDARSFFDEYQPDSEWPRVWGHVDATQLDAGTQPGAAGYSGDRQGLIVGIDYALDDDLRFGASLAQVTDEVDYETPGDSAELSGTYLTLNAAGRADSLLWSALLGMGYHGIDAERVVTVGTRSGIATGSTQAGGLYLYGDLAWPLAIGRLGVAPLLGLGLSRINVRRYEERGAAPVDLDALPQSYDGANSHLGARLRYPSAGGAWSLEARATWVHEFADTAPTLRVRFQASPDVPYSVYGTRPDADAVQLGARVNALLGKQVTGYLEFNGNWQGDVERQGMLLGFSKDW